MGIRTKPVTQKYRDNYDAIFRKQPDKTEKSASRNKYKLEGYLERRHAEQKQITA